MEPLIELQDVSKTFAGPGRRGGVQALRRVSLRLDAGRTTGLVGGSGSGKTTLGNVVAGLERPSSGAVFYRGLEVGRLSGAQRRAFRRNVQVMFQDPVQALNPRFSVGDLIAEPFRIHRDLLADRRRGAVAQAVTQLMDAVALPRSLVDARPPQISGGQCQRVGLARALALRPELIVLDESLSALDAPVQERIVVLLEQLQRRFGVGYLFITHDLKLARRVAEQLVVLHRGEVVVSATSQSVMQEIQHPYVLELRQAMLRIGEWRFQR